MNTGTQYLDETSDEEANLVPQHDMNYTALMNDIFDKDKDENDVTDVIDHEPSTLLSSPTVDVPLEDTNAAEVTQPSVEPVQGRYKVVVNEVMNRTIFVV